MVVHKSEEQSICLTHNILKVSTNESTLWVVNNFVNLHCLYLVAELSIRCCEECPVYFSGKTAKIWMGLDYLCSVRTMSGDCSLSCLNFRQCS